jgi:mycothiol synthase
MTTATPYHQLCMIFPEHRLTQPLDVTLPEGYALRTYQTGDDAGFFALMAQAGFGVWDADRLRPWLPRIVPESWFFIIEAASGEMVATAMGLHDPTDFHPQGGELGWVAANLKQSGKSLGKIVSSAVMARLIAAGYQQIHLYSEDWRPAALKTYLRMGFLPYLYLPDMLERWRVICEQVNMPFTPQGWIQKPSP